MKESPDYKMARENMLPGVITKDGFIGEDPRSLSEIIESDETELLRLGTSCDEVGEKLVEITKAAISGLGADVETGNYTARSVECIGGIPCPFGHSPLISNGMIRAKNTETDEVFKWTVLCAHLIREHHFFQGKGTPFRIEPEKIARFLGLAG